MTGSEVPYWFWQGFGLVVFTVVSVIFYKWVDFKFFQKEDKWNGAERRHVVEVDQLFLDRFLATYERHVKAVEALTESASADSSALSKFARAFEAHDEKEDNNQKLIKNIHKKVVEQS